MDVPWEHWRSFLAVARHGSLSAAARALRLTQPTLGRHIEQLERIVGAALFTRSPRGLLTTETALALVPMAETMESAAEAMTRAASGAAGEIAGVVRITASEVVGAEVLPPILARFSADHPAIAIELALSNRNQDLARGEADLAVRMARPTQGALVARRVGRTPIGLYAHRDYLARFGTPQSLADLAQHCVIGFDRDDSSARMVGAKAPFTREAFRFRCDDELAQIAALRAGVGIGGCQEGVARKTPELVPVLPGAVRFGLEMWLVMHEDLKATRRVRLLYDALAAGLADYLRGRGLFQNSSPAASPLAS